MGAATCVHSAGCNNKGLVRIMDNKFEWVDNELDCVVTSPHNIHDGTEGSSLIMWSKQVPK